MSSNRPLLGFWLETESQTACELAATLGYELMILDMEHGVISPTAADRLIVFSKSLALTVFSRVSAAERVPIQQALDAGADGVIISQIQNAEHAQTVTAFAKYPPGGSRGIGFNRTMAYGATEADFCDRENRRVQCFPMIETPGALDEAHEIAALITVDGLFLGPGDLSLTRGAVSISGLRRILPMPSVWSNRPSRRASAGQCRPQYRQPSPSRVSTMPHSSPYPTISVLCVPAWPRG